MSVIGPRPALWNQDVLIAEREKYHANDVKPGLTGWAQINGRDELEIPVKAKLDGEYVEKESLLFDIKCFLGTIGSVLSSDGVVEGGTGELTKAGMPILYSCHPRSRKRLEASGFQLDKRVIQHEPLGFHDYNCLQMNAFAVVSDSGTLPEESSFFTSVGHPFPAVCIRTSTERPEALDKGCFVLAGIDSNSLVQAVETAVAMNENGDYGIPVPDYVEENVSTKVVKIIQSYTGVVNKMVWRKF